MTSSTNNKALGANKPLTGVQGGSAEHPPVITIDGPAGSGKGTLAARLASKLDWQCLDSGAIYRSLCVFITEMAADISMHNIGNNWEEIRQLASELRVAFERDPTNQNRLKVLINGEDKTERVRSEEIAIFAAKVAVDGEVRIALRDLQRSFRQWPGLIADGRDMGTTVFPDATLKIFLTANEEARIQRKALDLAESAPTPLEGENQGQQQPQLRQRIMDRDTLDKQRKHSPMQSAADAITIDSSLMTPDEVETQVWSLLQNSTI